MEILKIQMLLFEKKNWNECIHSSILKDVHWLLLYETYKLTTSVMMQQTLSFFKLQPIYSALSTGPNWQAESLLTQSTSCKKQHYQHVVLSFLPFRWIRATASKTLSLMIATNLYAASGHKV